MIKGKHKFYASLALFQVTIVVLAGLLLNKLIGSSVAAEGAAETVQDPAVSIALAFSAAIAIAGASLAAGMTIKTVGTAAISALTENEDVFFKAFLVIALGEALAIYGLIVAILLWIKIP